MLPADFCRELLAEIDVSEERRRRRKRNTTADAIGLAMKRDLLERAIAANPAADDFEAWLFEQTIVVRDGGLQALALSILEEWRGVR